MLLGLIFRGVAFEFRFKATGKSRRIWDYSFHFGSLTATFMQGVYWAPSSMASPWTAVIFPAVHWTG
jgi:cytochrome bd-type quinol oxidase subunit 2